jgi:hypothetical protein
MNMKEVHHPVRYWSDRDCGLSELMEEEWMRLGPFPRRYRRRWVLDRTYSLIRFVQ